MTITAPPEGPSYDDVMAKATGAIRLEDLGIPAIKQKRAITGAIVLEVQGPESQAKAASLAQKLAEALDGTGARVTTPTKTAELRVRGLDVPATPQMVAEAVAREGGCPVNTIQTGVIRPHPRGQGTLWLRCPLTAARKVCATGKLRVGWAMVRVEALEARPLQCYRCLAPGHARCNCTSADDWSGRCYRCGEEGHNARACTAPPKCPRCAAAGKPAGHRLGSATCPPPPKPKKSGTKSPARAVGKEQTIALPPASEEPLPQRQPRRKPVLDPEILPPRPTAATEAHSQEEAMDISTQ